MPRDPHRAFHWALTLVFSTGLSVWACSNTNKEQLQAAGLAKGCSLASDCKDPLVCVFQLCHNECATTSDCLRAYGPDSGARCVSSGESGAAGGGGAPGGGTTKGGVCTFPKDVVAANKGTKGIDTACTKNSQCAGSETCGPDGQCRDGCASDGDCLGTQQCVANSSGTGVCADPAEITPGGPLSGGGGESATGGTGGTGGSSGKGGSGGTGIGNGGMNGEVIGGGGAGDMVVNECPDTKGTNPVEHDGSTPVSSPETWKGLHHVTGGLSITSSLTLAPCAVVKFGTNAYMYVNNNGSLKALGGTTNPVVFTSDKSVPKKGDWGGIAVAKDASSDSKFLNVIVEYAGNGYVYGYNAISLPEEAQAAFDNVLIRHTGDDYCALGIDANSSPASLNAIQIQDSKKGLCIGADVVGLIGSLTSDSPISVNTTTLAADSTWKDFGTPYALSGGSLAINAQLTLQAGVTIKMPANANINVDNGGALITEGTDTSPVTITSAKTSPGPGDWYYLVFGANASNNSLLTNTVIEYGGSNGYPSVQVTNNSSAGFSGVTVRKTGGPACAIQIDSGANIMSFENVSFEGNDCPLSVPSSQIGSLDSLTADGGYVEVNPETVTKAVTWQNFGIPYRLQGSFTVQAAWTVDAGVEVQMPHGAYINVSTNGAIKANGTSSKPVLFDSSIDGPSPGEWNYIEFNSDAAGTSKFAYTDFSYGGGYAGNGVIYINGKPVAFDHCKFENNLQCDYYLTTAANSAFNDTSSTTDNSMSSDGSPYPCN